MKELSVERAGVEDAAVILDLQKRAYQSEAEIYGEYTIPPLTQTLEQLEADFESQSFLKATLDGQIVGSVRAMLAGDSCLTGRLIVAPAFQNRGIGTRLLKEIEQLFPGAKRFELFTGERSERNLYLYRREGYRPFRSEAISEATTLVFLEKRAASGWAGRRERPTMDGNKKLPAGPGRWPRRLGLGLSSAAAAFWLLIGVLGAFSEGEPWTTESSLLAGLVLAATLATAISWRRLRAGAALLIIAGAAFCVFGYVTAGRNRWLAVAVSGLPFLAAGALLLVGARRAAHETDA